LETGGIESPRRWLTFPTPTKLVEGIVTVLCVPLVLWFVPDYPARAKWLSEDDKQYISDRIAVRGGGYTKEHASRKEILTTLFHPRMVAHYFAYLYVVLCEAVFAYVSVLESYG